MRYVDLRVVLPDELLHPMQRFIREEDVVEYEEIVSWNIDPDADREYELFYVEADREPYEAKVRTVDTVIDYNIAPIDEESFHVYAENETREADRRWRRAFAAMDLVVVPPIAYDTDAGLHMTIVGDGEDIQAMLETLPGGIEVEVKEIGTYERRRGLVGALTERQREAVQAALAAGYYAVPREGELGDVADAIGCAESTASELLRRAEREALTAVLDRRGAR